MIFRTSVVAFLVLLSASSGSARISHRQLEDEVTPETPLPEPTPGPTMEGTGGDGTAPPTVSAMPTAMVTGPSAMPSAAVTGPSAMPSTMAAEPSAMPSAMAGPSAMPSAMAGNTSLPPSDMPTPVQSDIITNPPTTIGGTGMPTGVLPSLAEIVGSVPFLSILNNLLNATTLITVLQSPDVDLTAFAPTDESFAALVGDPLGAKLIMPEYGAHLVNVLLYHLVGMSLFSTDLVDGLTGPSLNGEDLTIVVNETGSIFVQDSQGGLAEVIGSDVDASNGVAHVINAVLQPSFVNTSIVDSLGDDYSTLKTLLDLTNLTDALDMMEDVTLFAPTNAAFDMIDNETLAMLLNDTEALSNILLYHVAGEVLPSFSAPEEAAMVTMLNGDNITAISINGAIYINGNTTVVEADILSNQGISHGIDMVLIPPETMPTDAPVPTDAPTAEPVPEPTEAPVAPPEPTAPSPTVGPPVALPTDAPTSAASLIGASALCLVSAVFVMML